MMRCHQLLSLLVITLALLLPGPAGAAANSAVAALEKARVVGYSGHEGISELFAFDVDLAVPDRALNFTMVVGQTLTLRLAVDRTLHGMVESIEQLGMADRMNALYRIQVVPSVSRLKGRINSRTFATQNVRDIIQRLLNEAGISAFEFRLERSHPPKEIAVQYRESDFAFMSRLLEAEGIHYHFEQTSGGHKVFFSDSNIGFPMLAVSKLAMSVRVQPSVTRFTRGQGMHSGRIDAGDYNWRTPSANLTGVAQVSLFQDMTEQIRPAGIGTQAEAQTVAQTRLEARIASAQDCRGESTYTHLQAGSRFVLQGHYRADFNRDYVLTAIEHESTPEGYRNTFRCLPANLVYRPEPITPKPVIAGVVSGIVVGASNEERYYDEYGRVRVSFPWSAAGTREARWVRVAQMGGGTKSLIQTQFLPDIGAEVAVAFDHGDPDRPLVVGTVYNNESIPPYKLPERSNAVGLKMRSSKGGSAAEFSEIFFDTTKGEEKLRLVGQKDIEMRSKNDVLVQGDRDIRLQSGPHYLTVGPNGISASSGIGTMAPVDLNVAAGRKLSLNAGDDLSLNAAKDLVIDTGDNIVLRSGKASISLRKNGDIAIKGETVSINGSDRVLIRGPNVNID